MFVVVFFPHRKSSFSKKTKNKTKNPLGTEVHFNSLSWISLLLKRPNEDRAEAEVGEEEEEEDKRSKD